MVAAIYQRTNGRLPIVGVGGVRTASDVQAKLDAGASLVQFYTNLVYEGPGLAGRILRGLEIGD
jgi:dihydroorotate dehydrogenase